MAESILSDNELNTLMGGVDDTKETEEEVLELDVEKFDFTQRDKIIRGRMPALDIIHDRFARVFRVTLSTSLRMLVEIKAESSVLLKFSDFIRNVETPSLINIYRMQPLRGQSIMVLDTSLVYTLIEILFGGKSIKQSKKMERDFTQIEQKILNKIVVLALEDLHAAWRPVFPIQISLARSEINPQFASIAPLNEAVMVTMFTVKIGDRDTKISMCLPYSMLEPIRSQLESGFQSDTAGTDIINKTKIKANIKNVLVDMSVQLGRKDLSVKEFLLLKVDDEIDLGVDIERPLSVKVGKIEKFSGIPGTLKGNKAIKITQMLYEPPLLGVFL